MIICIVLSGLVLQISKNNFDATLELNNYNTISRLTNAADISFRNMEYIVKKLYENPYVQAYMFYSDPKRLHYNVEEHIQSVLSAHKDLNRHIDSIYIYSEINDKFYTTEGEFTTEVFTDKEILSLTQANDSVSFAFMRKKENIYPNVITFIYKTVSDDKYGAIILNVVTSSIVNNITDMCDVYDDFYILDSDNKILWNKKEDIINTKIDSYPVFKNININDTCQLVKENMNYSCVASKSSLYYGWKYVNMVAVSDYDKQLKSNNTILILPLIMIFFSGLLASCLIAMYTYRPIERMVKVVQNPHNYFIDRRKRYKHDEVDIVASKILMLIDSNEKLNESINNKVSLLNDTQLKMLQAQINPHFLYNVLNVLNGSIVAECGYNSNSSEMVMCLSHLLRYALKTDKILVPFKKELEYLKKYIQLLEYRYKNQFSVVYDIDNTVLDTEVLKMSLQPLVENCVEHGFADKHSGGLITIRAQETENGVQISVSDNGTGMTAFDQNFIFDSDEHKINFNSDHIGLKSVIYRYKIVFNDSADIKIQSNPSMGTTVIIDIVTRD